MQENTGTSTHGNQGLPQEETNLQQQVQQDLPFTPRTWRPRLRSAGVEESVEEQAEQLARRLYYATDVLLEKLFAYLSQLPEEEDDDEVDDDEELGVDHRKNHTGPSTTGGGGMTLPAAAVGWLCSQYFPPECEDGRRQDVSPTVWSSVALRDRLRLLHFLLPRVTHLRVTRQAWPPELPAAGNRQSNRRLRRRQQDLDPQQDLEASPLCTTTQNESHHQQERPPQDLNCSVVSVSSALTMDEPHRSLSTAAAAALPTRRAFWEFMQQLQNRPSLDMRIFSRLRVLVLESIPPSWIHRLYALQPTLEVLKWNRACLQSDLPRLFWKKPSDCKQVSRRIYPRLTHLNLDYCGLGELSSLPKVLDKCAPHLECLSMAHNELVSQKVALTGLRQASQLQKLNLSHNNLTVLPQAHLYLGGQLRCLKLSHNALTSVTGLDRLYALEELWLDHNCLLSGGSIAELARLCQLPRIQQLYLQGNRSLERDHPLYIKQVFEWFQQYRGATTPHELPHLNGHAITIDQWNSLMIESIPVTTTTCRFPRVHRLNQRHTVRRIRPSSSTTVGSTVRQLGQRQRPLLTARQERDTTSLTNESLSNRPLSFSLQDVLISLHQEQNQTKQLPGGNTSDGAQIAAETAEAGSSVDNKDDVNEEKDEGSYLMTRTIFEPDDLWTFPLGEIPESLSDMKSSDDKETEDGTELTISTTTKEECRSSNESLSQQMEMTADTPKLENGGKSMDTIKNPPGMFDVMAADWEDIVERVAGGLIPDGRPRMPVPESLTPAINEMERAFSLEATDLLSPETTDAAPLMPPHTKSTNARSPTGGDDQSGISSSFGIRSNNLPDLIYPDDSSVPSSLGTTRDDFPSHATKFQIAEENATYDGPHSWLKMNVLENLNLYFEIYVFPSSLKSTHPMDDEVDEGHGEPGCWQTIALRYPRIQLWPEDRQWLDSSSPADMISPTGSSREIDGWAISTRESFVRLWTEDVIPCGKPALRRLAPNRRNRLGFHGDQLYLDGLPDPNAECRKVFLCLSSSALYIILRADDVTKQQDEKGIKKRFPKPINDRCNFEDAPWPHAVARHSFQDLQTITIGFEFQRLILQFANPTVRKTDPYVYVLLTSNKNNTVSILQEIQSLVKENKREIIDLNSDAAPVTIENDSQLVLDALQATVAPEVVGTIIHYQVVQQRWKHGERGTVRRVCVVTDTKLFLMDEDYHADSHKPLDPPATGVAAFKKMKQVDLAKVSYRKVDEATLKQVSEVQAAGANPKAITIVISPLSRLSRTHRWRLVCRDSVGAERLVDDVRKAVAMAEE